MELTQDLLKELFYYKDGALYWRVKRKGCKLNARAGTLKKFRTENRYIITMDYKQYLSSRLIFLYHKGYLPEKVDHRDRNTLNDRIENLRAANCRQNQCNRTSRKNSSSQYLGVSLYKSFGKWGAQIRVNNKPIYLGSFPSEDQAAKAYNEAAKLYHGEFANLNVIENSLTPS